MRIALPEPIIDGEISLEQSLAKRRSVREYSDEPLALAEVSQLLWAAQGITAGNRYRTAPSAGALYPLEIHVVAGDVDGLAAGIYRYAPEQHELILTAEGDFRAQLANAALGQSAVREGAIDLVFTAVYQRTTKKYGDRGIRYVHMEVGHAAQNVCLQAAAIDLGVVTIGAFHDDQVGELLNLPEDEAPLYILPVGRQQ
jgi:SagB-type dehydrogenase family enzyme